MPRPRPIVKNGKYLPDNFAIANKFKQTPLEYMLSVMNDETVPASRRDRMAICCAAYCHPRMYDNRLGKKDGKASAAQTAGVGTEWGNDLQFTEGATAN